MFVKDDDGADENFDYGSRGEGGAVDDKGDDGDGDGDGDGDEEDDDESGGPTQGSQPSSSI